MTTLWTNVLIYAMFLVGTVLGYLRIRGHKSQAYQAVAHLFVGGLIAGAFTCSVPLRCWCGTLAVVLSVLEVVCFLMFRSRKPVGS